MPKVIHFILVFLVCLTMPTSAPAAAKLPADVWNFYHFDGTAFAPGPAVDGSAFLAVREKLLPVVLTVQAATIEQAVLPDGAGAIAGICYIQSSGGKLGGGGGYKPYPRLPLLISTEGREFVTVQTDDHGYFVVVLPAGVYSVGSSPLITVERGMSTLVPLRAGKRMVD